MEWLVIFQVPGGMAAISNIVYVKEAETRSKAVLLAAAEINQGLGPFMDDIDAILLDEIREKERWSFYG